MKAIKITYHGVSDTFRVWDEFNEGDYEREGFYHLPFGSYKVGETTVESVPNASDRYDVEISVDIPGVGKVERWVDTIPDNSRALYLVHVELRNDRSPFTVGQAHRLAAALRDVMP